MNKDLIVTKFELETNNLFDVDTKSKDFDDKAQPVYSPNSSFRFKNPNHPNEDTISLEYVQNYSPHPDVLEAIKVVTKYEKPSKRKDSDDSVVKMPYPRPPRKPKTAFHRKRHRRIFSH